MTTGMLQSENETTPNQNVSEHKFDSQSCPVEFTTIPATVIIIISMIILSFLIITTTSITKLRNGREQRQLAKFIFLMHCTSYFMSMLIYEIGYFIEGAEHRTLCAVVAVLLHYFVLVTFMFGLMETIIGYLLFIVFTGPNFKAFRWKFLLLSTGIALLPVSAVLAYQLQSYDNIHGICWIRPNNAYYFFVIPASLVTILSVIGFFIIFICAIRWPVETAPARSTRRRVISRITYTLISVICNGLSWCFGYLVSTSHCVVFYYLMSASAISYSLVMFRRSLDPISRSVWKNILYPSPPQETSIAISGRIVKN